VLDSVVRLLDALLGWVARRMAGGMVCHVREPKRVGGEDDPAVYLTVVVENPQGQNAFVESFEVKMLDPFRAFATKYEYRSNANTTIHDLAVNIPGHGVSQPLIVIASFDRPLPYTSACRARIRAIGRGGFRRRWEEFSCGALR